MEQRNLEQEKGQTTILLEGPEYAVVPFPSMSSVEDHLRPGAQIIVTDGPFNGQNGEVRFVDIVGRQLTVSIQVRGKDVFIPLSAGQVRRR